MNQKASKNGSGGDERNMYFRRYKSTSNSSKASSSVATLAEKEGEPESSNRLKHSGVPPKHPGTAKTNIKSKLRTPVKTGLGQSTNRVNKPNIVSTNKEIKKIAGVVKGKSQMTKMKQDMETAERKQKSSNVPESKEAAEVESNKQSSETNEQPSEKHENGTSNEINSKEISSEENSKENGTTENGNTEQNGASISEVNDKEEDFNLQLEAEENSNKSENIVPRGSSEVSKDDDSQNNTIATIKGQDDSQTDTESCSVDVVESTTSDMSEATASTAPSVNKNKDNEIQDGTIDPVSYDSSIMLKDVKIKLNDCLKDSKTEEENDVDQSLPEYSHKEATFGKTLRKISGRHSIDRMRNITLRDRQPSPNSSLFVNTSNVSFAEDRNSDFKILHHRSALSELTSSNGATPYENRKRRLLQETGSSTKKPKKEESSFLNTSFEILKYPFSPRRPVQVSTPYNVTKEKINFSTSEEIKADESGTVKKWCVIM